MKQACAALPRLGALMLAALVLAWAPPAAAKKVALIVANSVYYKGTSLRNPVIDAQIVKQAAEKAGFAVTLKENLTLDQFTEALYQFQQDASNADVAMIYYAGHGIETPAGKYVIPTDADLPAPFFLSTRAINVNQMIEALSRAHTSLLVLDACRENGFASNWTATTRAMQFGFSADIQADDMLALFSAGPGQQAEDGTGGQGSPFAQAFAHWLPEPGLELMQLPTRVTGEVMKDTGNRQRPAYSGSLGETVVLVPKISAPDPIVESSDWDNAVRANTADGFISFLNKYPKSARRRSAIGYIVDLGGDLTKIPPETAPPSQGAAAPVAQPVAPRPAPPAVIASQPQGSSVANFGLPTGGGSGPAIQPQRPVQAANSGPAPNPASSGAFGSLPTTSPSAPSTNPTPSGALAANTPTISPAANTVATQAPPPAQSPVQTFAPPPPAASPVATQSPATEAPAQTFTSPSPNRPQPIPSDGATAVGDQNASALMSGYVPGTATARDRAALPVFPPVPKFSDDGYPTCKDNFKSAIGAMAQINAIDECTRTLNKYYETVMGAFSQKMIDHQNELSRIYKEEVAPKSDVYTVTTQQGFYQRVLDESAKSKPDGIYYSDYRATEERLNADKQYLQQQRPIYVNKLSQGG